MKTFKVISMLLMYPESDWLSALPEMHAALLDEAGFNGNATVRLAPLLDLLEEYWKHDFDASAAELPDYVPLFLEFLSLLPADEALELLGDAVHVLAAVGRKLDANGSPYAAAFQLLEALSPVAAQELAEPPVRDMDEAMEMFGPSMDGVEPLMNPGPQVAVVQMPASRRPVAPAQTH